MVTTPTIGQPDWGQPLNDALNNLQTQIDAVEASDVDSVNGQTGVVVLDAADVGAPETTDVVLVVKPEQFGAVGDGVTDDTAAVNSAFAAATALRESVIGGNVFAPGATVQLDGTYLLSTLAATIVASCNIDGSDGTLIAPTGFGSSVILVGHETSANILQAANIILPRVTKAGPPTSFTASSVGVKVQNIHDSVIVGRRVDYFETGWLITGLGQGTCYNSINLGRVDLCKVAHKLVPTTGGWVNQNVFIGGGITQSPNTLDGSGIRRTGWRHLVIDGSGGVGTVSGNTFAVSYEGDLSEYYFDIKAATSNVWLSGCRFEQGTAARSTTLSTDTFTDNSHGLVVGDMVVMFANTTLPGGMKRGGEAYWVSNVPNANTFKIAATKGGPTLSFTSNGSGVVYYVPPRILIDGTGDSTFNNDLKAGYFSYPGQLDLRETNSTRDNRWEASLLRRDTLMPGRNRIINGDFRINQRGYVSGATIASGSFGFDRWKSLQAGTTVTFTASPQGPMVLLDGYISQVIERATIPAGTYTLWWEGNAQARMYPVGGSVPSLANGPITVDFDGTTDFQVDFFGTTAAGSRVSRVQLELGTVATPFEQGPISSELEQCKRYFQRYGNGTAAREMLGTGIANSTTSAFFPMRLPVEMRTTPTVSVTSAATFRVNIGTSVILASSVSLDATSNARTLRVNASVAAGLTTGNGATLDTGDGYFDLSAEL